jgi:membrane protease YdiL (CAAX protease family)
MLSRPWPWVAVAALALPVAWIVASAGHGLPVRAPWADLAWLAVLAACEEVVFRGGLQAALLRRPAWARRRFGASGANSLASVAFALAHMPAHGPLHALLVLPVSVLLGVAYEASGGRLRLPIALHLWFNAALYGASWVLGR